MKNNENLLNELLASTKGMQRAKAPEDLFARIESQINSQNTPIIVMMQIRKICAVAAMLLLINVTLGSIYLKKNFGRQNTELSELSTPRNSSLLSDYNIYE